MIVKITNELLDRLTEQAKASPRLRMNLDLRDSDDDTSQRMLNAIEPDSVVPIHRHQKTWETIVVVPSWKQLFMGGDDLSIQDKISQCVT